MSNTQNQFAVDLGSLQLSNEQRNQIHTAVQKVVIRELATVKLNKRVVRIPMDKLSKFLHVSERSLYKIKHRILRMVALNITSVSAEDKIRCPASECKPGSDIIGMRQDDGIVAIFPQPLPIDQVFVKTVHLDPLAPEIRFRFSNKCIRSGCKQWTGSRCGVIDTMMHVIDDTPELASVFETAELPSCGIRPTCRWFLQSGGAACQVCPYIMTHASRADTYVPITSSPPSPPLSDTPW